MENEPSQPIGCVGPGPEAALDLHLGSDCEPQQPLPLVKEMLGMGWGNSTQPPQPNGSEETLGEKNLHTNREEVVRKSSSLPGTFGEEAPSFPRMKLPVEMSPL